MNIEQLRAFANSDEQHIRQIALTREGARQLIAEYEREAGQLHRAGFEIPTARCDAPGYRAMEQAAVDRMLFDDGRAAL